MHDDLRRCLDEAFADHARFRSVLGDEVSAIIIESMQLQRTPAVMADHRQLQSLSTLKQPAERRQDS